MSVSDVVVIVLVCSLIAAFPAWKHSRNWGYYPSAGVSLVLLVFVIYVVSRTV